MPITSIDTRAEELTIEIVSEFPVPVRRLWDAYADPRQLERFWGPEEWPARFHRHDFAPGGFSKYVMTGPDGESSGGYWEFLAVDELNSFEVLDGFTQSDGSPNRDMPTMRMTFRFEPTDEGSRVTCTTYFNSHDELEQLAGMGMMEGMKSAMSQMDAVITDLKSFAAGRLTEAEVLSDTKVRVTRIVRGTPEQVWRAHTDANLMKQWMLGPEGWTMPVCDVAEKVGDSYRYEWENAATGDRFGFVGELLEEAAPYRAVTTEQMIGMEGPPTTNEMTLTPVDGGTLLSIVITYPNAEVRDIVLATGMTDGMETSYARLESEVLGAA